MNGPVGLILGVGLGIIRTMYCDEDVVADWVPVDVAISAVITSAWYQGCASELKKKEWYVSIQNKLKLIPDICFDESEFRDGFSLPIQLTAV